MPFGAVSSIVYVMLGAVLRGPFRDTNFAFFSWFFLRLLATYPETRFNPVAGFPAVRMGAVERGGELSSTLVHHICEYAAGLVFGCYCSGLMAGGPDIGLGDSWGGEGLEGWLRELVF